MAFFGQASLGSRVRTVCLAPTEEISATPAPGWSFFFQIGGKPW